jgi:hypothetical protein
MVHNVCISTLLFFFRQYRDAIRYLKFSSNYFLVTDGSVENERQICDMIKNHMINGESISPRIYTLGIGMKPELEM